MNCVEKNVSYVNEHPPPAPPLPPQNWLDVFIVTMSILDMVLSSVPSWLVRLMRALRVIRLFGRVKELRKMVTAVSASIFAMANAFFILVVILCICAAHSHTSGAESLLSHACLNVFLCFPLFSSVFLSISSRFHLVFLLMFSSTRA